MTRDDVIGWAREAGIEVNCFKLQARFGMDALIGADSTEKLQRMCELAAASERRKHQTDKAETMAAEREACATVCEQRALDNDVAASVTGSNSMRSAAWQMRCCADAIRARKP